MVLVWRITEDSPNSPNFPPAKLSRYTVYIITLLATKIMPTLDAKYLIAVTTYVYTKFVYTYVVTLFVTVGC